MCKIVISESSLGKSEQGFVGNKLSKRSLGILIFHKPVS